MLTKVTADAELEHHLGYQKNEKVSSGNCCNGYSRMQVQTEDGVSN